MNLIEKKVGVLGGGQLGKMLGQAASRWHLDYYVLEKDAHCPASVAANVHTGDFRSYDDVLHFGSHMDLLSVEIEAVSTRALGELAIEGKTVYPQPECLDIIKDKGNQRRFYQKHNLPQPKFSFYDGPKAIRQAVDSGELSIPFVQKSRTEGYDGRGVLVVNSSEKLDQLLEVASLVEELVNIDKELAVIVARNPSGDLAVYDPVELVFDPEANLVDYLAAPARISSEIAREVKDLALQCIEAYELVGLLAIEFFLDRDGKITINEVAPRPHNSGHHTIEAAYCSQFEQHLRAILDLPLGFTGLHSPAVMLNILGAPKAIGTPDYTGLLEVLNIPGAHPHLYGKTNVRPFRKMGHITILAETLEEALERAELAKAYTHVPAR